MTSADFGFWFLIIYILGITIGIFILIKVLTIIKSLIGKFRSTNKTLDVSMTIQMGELVLFLTFLGCVLMFVTWFTTLDFFSTVQWWTFDYIINEMVPMVWYILLFYGILINLMVFSNNLRS